MARLKEIVAKIESSQIDVDELEDVVKEAVRLVGICRAKLHGTQSAVETALEEITGQGNTTDVVPDVEN